jgi:hypothetical protein
MSISNSINELKSSIFEWQLTRHNGRRLLGQYGKLEKLLEIRKHLFPEASGAVRCPVGHVAREKAGNVAQLLDDAQRQLTLVVHGLDEPRGQLVDLGKRTKINGG